MFDEDLDVPQMIDPEPQTLDSEQSEDGIEPQMIDPEPQEKNTEPQELDTMAEQLANERAERKRLEREMLIAKEAMGRYWQGEDIVTMADHATAQSIGIAPQEVTMERLAQEEIAQKDRELAQYRKKEVQRLMSDDLAVIQKLDSKIKNLDELGQPYLKLINAGVDAATAYYAVKASIKPKNPSMGDVVGSSSKTEENQYAAMSADKFEEMIKAAERGELKKK